MLKHLFQELNLLKIEPPIEAHALLCSLLCPLSHLNQSTCLPRGGHALLSQWPSMNWATLGHVSRAWHSGSLPEASHCSTSLSPDASLLHLPNKAKYELTGWLLVTHCSLSKPWAQTKPEPTFWQTKDYPLPRLLKGCTVGPFT